MYYFEAAVKQSVLHKAKLMQSIGAFKYKNIQVVHIEFTHAFHMATTTLLCEASISTDLRTHLAALARRINV